MFKKIISLLLVILLIPCINLYAEDSKTQVSGNTSEYAAGIISALYPEAVTDSEGCYTRSEFLTVLVNLMNFGGVSDAGSIPYADVLPDSDFYGVLSFGLNSGIVSKADCFYPDNKITVIEALTMAIRAAGYDDYAANHGGYPYGYLKTANELDMTLDIAAELSHELSYADGLIILYNLLEVDVLEAKTFVDGNVEYTKTGGINFLYTYRKIRIAKGLVEANQFSGIYSRTESCAEGYIKADNTLYKGDYSHLLGYNAKVYYNDDSARSIVYAHSFENTVQTFKTEDAIELSNGCFYYLDNAGTKRKSPLKQGYTILYNGKTIPLGRFKAITSEDRVWTFIENSGDGTYDIVSVTDTRYMVASRVDTAAEAIYDYNKKQSFLDLEECSYKVYNADGTPAELHDIITGTPIGYSISEDGELCTIKIFKDYAAGKITAMETGKKIYIDDVAYDLSKYYIDNINTFTIGSKAMCYLGNDNRVIFIDEIIDDGMTYAYAVDIQKSLGIDDVIYIKMFTQSGDMLIAPLKEKLVYNGDTKKDEEAYVAIRQLIDDGVGLTGDDLMRHDGTRVFKYTMDPEGRVNRIALSYQLIKLSDITEPTGAYDRPLIYSSNNAYYRYSIFSPYVVTNSSTIFFKIPQSASGKDVDDNYEIVDSGFFANGECFVTTYDVTAGGFAPVVLVSSDDTTVADGTGSAVVERVYETINKEGTVCYGLELYMNGEYGLYYAIEGTTEAASYNTIKNSVGPGDIVRATVNNKKEIKSVIHDFDYSEPDIINSAAEETMTSWVVNVANPDKTGFSTKENGYLWGSVYSSEGENLIIVPYGTDMSADILHTTDITAVNFASTTAAVSKTVFVKMIKTRDGIIERAEVYTEKSSDAIKSYMQVGERADFIVSRTRYRQPSLTVVYTYSD